MSVWKQMVITSQLDERIERVRNALGYKAKWRVIDEALKLLEEKIADQKRLFIEEVAEVMARRKMTVTRNVKPLLGLLFKILSDKEISEADKDAIVVAMIEAGAKKYKEARAPAEAKKAEEEAEKGADELLSAIASGRVAE